MPPMAFLGRVLACVCAHARGEGEVVKESKDGDAEGSMFRFPVRVTFR